MRILSPRIHGYLDYLVVALLLLAPSIFGFVGVAATICYVLAVVQFGMSLLTAYPLGAVKVIPFPVHGGIEFATSIFLVASPWLFNFAHYRGEQLFFVISGIALFLVWMVTNYRAATLETTATTGVYR